MYTVTVLGGRAAAVAPRAGCAGYLVTMGGKTIVIDLGPGTFTELLAHVDVPRIDALIVSHGHADHILDLATMHNYVAYRPNPMTPVPLYLAPGVHERLAALGSIFHEDHDGESWIRMAFQPDDLEPTGALALGDVTVSFERTHHSVPCWALRLDSGGESLGYTADTGRIDNLVPFFRGCDLLISEATYGVPEVMPDQPKPHLTLDEAATLAKDVDAGALLLTHLGFERPDVMLERAESIFDGPVALASPGLTISVDGRRTTLGDGK